MLNRNISFTHRQYESEKHSVYHAASEIGKGNTEWQYLVKGIEGTKVSYIVRDIAVPSSMLLSYTEKQMGVFPG